MNTSSQQNGRVVILGIYVTDLTFRAGRMPQIGETIAGSAFAMGPGGKGSNQAVAAARAGADVVFCTRIGDDAFGAIARATWAAEGITARASVIEGVSTGAAHIFVDDNTGMNAIIVASGAAGTMEPADVDAIEADIASARVFVTQLEQPLEAARRGLEVARRHGVVTVFNPAPALPLDDGIFPLCDYITPNETEATALTGVPIANADAAGAREARRCGCALVLRQRAGFDAGGARIDRQSEADIRRSWPPVRLVRPFERRPAVPASGRAGEEHLDTVRRLTGRRTDTLNDMHANQKMEETTC